MTVPAPRLVTPYRPGYDPPPLPPISAHAELALLLRVLASYGYDDLRAGHVTVGQPDGTILINPRELCWPEVTAADIVTIDSDGVKRDGRFNPTIAYDIHLEVRRLRPDVGVIIHNHPRWSVVWGDCLRIPPIFDQLQLVGDRRGRLHRRRRGGEGGGAVRRCRMGIAGQPRGVGHRANHRPGLPSGVHPRMAIATGVGSAGTRGRTSDGARHGTGVRGALRARRTGMVGECDAYGDRARSRRAGRVRDR
jgi:hypothetical protein